MIDDSDVRKELDMAQNTYDLAVSTYNEQQVLAENGYAKAVQERNAAQKDYDRLSVLFQAGSVSQQEWETAQNRLRDAERDTRAFTLQDGKPVANESYALQIKNAEFELEKKKALNIPIVVYDRETQMIYHENNDGTRVVVGEKMRKGRYSERVVEET